MAAESSAGRETPDVSELRRQVSLQWGNTGRIVWADTPASRRLGVAAGDTHVSRAAPGTQSKKSRLIELGVQQSVRPDGGRRSKYFVAGLRPAAPDRVAASGA